MITEALRMKWIEETLNGRSLRDHPSNTTHSSELQSNQRSRGSDGHYANHPNAVLAHQQPGRVLRKRQPAIRQQRSAPKQNHGNHSAKNHCITEYRAAVVPG